METRADGEYLRAQKNDSDIEQMDPVDTFTLILRGYQKQALR